ncbi:hypothetical protein E2C01_091152 [Portunus trituberculatus]|uniref:Uncharacterized protein n=1 Tax=Portunus trituberculatus TaxID=210409 RepID=A0A5B7JNA0_PORTR|nr:hypothetical protein [Portunus trituberculatus]
MLSLQSSAKMWRNAHCLTTLTL